MTALLPGSFLRSCRLHGLLLGLSLLGGAAQAQTTGPGVGIGTTSPDASAVLELSTTTQGLLLPRLTQGQRDAIQNPAAGLLIYQTDNTPGLYLYGGTSWSLLPTSTQAADNLGNHTATQALHLGANALTGTGADLGSAVGVGVRADGGLNLGQNSPGNNVWLGYQAGNAGSYNLAAGYRAGASSSGNDNVLLGYSAGLSNTGSNSTIVGSEAGVLNAGADNAFFGHWAGLSNRAGLQNSFFGAEAGALNTTGVSNAFFGYRAGRNVTVGEGNTLLGNTAGLGTTTGLLNTFVGYSAGSANTTGTTNTALGYLAGPASGGTGLSNTTALGSNARVSQSNSLVLGGTGSSAVRVGIGTEAPAATLHVEGSTSTVRLAGLAGTGTRMVTADATGNLSTAAVPASTDAQQLGLSGSTLSLTNGGSVSLPDASSTNEIQTLGLSGSTLSLTSGGSVSLPDASSTNEIQTLGLSGSTLSLTNGGSVTLPATAPDNLGNHTATQNVQLADNWLSNDGSSEGLRVDNAGNVGVGMAPNVNFQLGVQASSITKRGLLVGLSGASTAYSLKLEHNGSNFVVRPASAGGTNTVLENSAGHLLLNPDGNRVGIGTSSPAQALDVSGSARVTGTLYMGYQVRQLSYTLSGNSRYELFLACPTGYKVMGGGGGHLDFNGAADDVQILYNGPDITNPDTTWRMIVKNTDGANRSFRMICTCARMDN